MSKLWIVAACALCIVPVLAAPGTPGAIPSDYAVRTDRGSSASPEYRATNRAHRFVTTFSGASVRIVPLAVPAWTLAIEARGYGSAERMRPLGLVQGAIDGARVTYVSPAPVESWLENSEAGLVQGFEIREAPGTPADAPLAITLAFEGDPSAKVAPGGRSLDLSYAGVRILRYTILRAVDSRGDDLPLHLETQGEGGVEIVVERAGPFPLTIETALVSAKGARKDAVPGSGGLFPEAAPANDTCAGATVIPADQGFPYTTALADINDATTTGDPVPRPACAFPGEAVNSSVWYQFTPTVAGTYTFSTCSITGLTVVDTVLGVYTSTAGCAGPFTQVAGGCDDDGCEGVGNELHSFLALPLAASTPYYVVAWNEGTDPTFDPNDPVGTDHHVALRVDRAVPPANDTCAGAIAIPTAGPFPYRTPVTADITDATTTGDPPTPSCLAGGYVANRSTWYTFTPPSSGLYKISSCASDGDQNGKTTVHDTLIGVYTSAAACAGPFTETAIGCDDDTCSDEGLQAVATTPLVGGMPYYIVAYQVGAAAPAPGHTALRLEIEPAARPSNDLCSQATTLTLDVPVEGTTQSGLDDYRAPATPECFSGVGQPTATSITTTGLDVAYTFTAPRTDLYSFRVTDHAVTTNLVLYVASDCPSGASPATVTCLRGSNRNTSFTSEEVSCLSIRGGAQVYVYVDATSATPGSPFTIEVNRCRLEAEANDTPATANPVACGIEGGVSIPPAIDLDYFSVGTFPTGSRLFALVDGVAGNSTDFDLRVTTDVDTLEYDDLDADLPFGSLAPTIDGTPLTSAAAYLRINTFNPGAIAEPYRLYSVIQPPSTSAVLEVEPNDTAAQATAAPLGYVTGDISSVTDVDFYSFAAQDGDLVFLGLDGAPNRSETPQTPFNAKLTIVDPTGKSVTVDEGTASWNGTSGAGSLGSTTPRSPGEALVWRARTTGTFYAKVEAGANAPRTGDYLLSISINCARIGVDSDADGVPDVHDCAPTDPAVAALPGEVASLTLGPAKSRLSWTSAGGGSTVYDVLRGSLGAFPVGPGGGDELCFDSVAGTTQTDPGIPIQKQGFWYVVRASNACGVGSYGFEGHAGVPTLERGSTTCP